MEEILELKKRRLMFIPQEDFNYLTYNLVFLLDGIGCSGTRYLKDHRKIGYLIELIGNEGLVQYLAIDKRNIEKKETKKTFQRAFSRGMQREHLMFRLCLALESKGILNIDDETKKGALLKVSLKKENCLKILKNINLYKDELENVEVLKRVCPRIPSIKLETLINNTFGKVGVAVWRV